MNLWKISLVQMTYNEQNDKRWILWWLRYIGKAVESFIIDSLEKWGCEIMARNVLLGGTLTSEPLPLVLHKVLFQRWDFFPAPLDGVIKWEEFLPESVVPRRGERLLLLLWHDYQFGWSRYPWCNCPPGIKRRENSEPPVLPVNSLCLDL